VVTIFTQRERMFAEAGVDSMATFRQRRRRGEQLEDRPLGDVFLVVDGLLTLREDFERLYDAVVTLAARGLGYGIHVVITANRWMEVRAQIKDTISTRLELKLNDAFDSEVDRRTAEKVPEASPGRGVSRDKLHFLGAVPVSEGQALVGDEGSEAELAAQVASLVNEIKESWGRAPAPRVRLLPRAVSITEMPPVTAEQREGSLRIPLGLGEADLAPLWHDFDADPFLVAFGDAESGKSSLLRYIGWSIAERRTPEQAKLLVVDYRRALLGELSDEHVVGYAGNETTLTELVERAVLSLQGRLPGADVTPQQLRARSWWSGPELIVLVDDYDLVATQRSNPLTPLVEFLPQAKDVGLRLVVVRRSGGVSRALYDPALGRLIELGSVGLLMSGSKDEGQVMGSVKMSEQPPGRGTLVRRGANAGLVQLAWRESHHV
jgi:DNA segregation ATPase FtsK/SpoIIIE, S-DNA-T family